MDYDGRALTQVDTIYGRFLAWEGDLITKQLEKFSAHTRNELSMLRSLILEGDNIIDIGAHIGTFALPFADFVKQNGRIYSFEANAENYGLLVRNIAMNGLEQVICATNAVIAETSDLQFSVRLPDGGNSGMYYFTTSESQAGARVSSINIDEWHQRCVPNSRIDLIKVDVEGAEMQVLESCRGIIESLRPVLFIEINSEALARFECTGQDIETFLAPLGYKFFRNIGPRNSDHDRFRIASLKTIESGGAFFDLLAVHPTDVRYPKKAVNLGDLFPSAKSTADSELHR